MSISNTQRARLGAFVLFGVVLLILFATIPLGIKLTDKYKRYTSFFEGESLSGLEQGAEVKFNGVPIGKVEKISYLPNDLSRVKVELKIQDDFPMKVDMKTQTGALGITGLKYVEITGGTDTSALLKPGSEIESQKSMMGIISGKAEAITAKVEILLNHLNAISNPDSLKGIKTIIDNVAAITDDARGFFTKVEPKMDRMTSSTERIITKVDGIAGDVKSFTGTFNQNVSGAQLATIFSRIDSSAVALKSLSDNLSLMIRQTREDFSVSMENLREASENANQLTKVLAENPSLLLKGETQRGRDIR